MKTLTLSRLAALAGCLLIISGAQAQQTSVDGAPTGGQDDFGLLGKTYFAVDADLIEYRNFPSSPTGYGSEIAINLEANDHLDVGLAYDFSHAKNTESRTTDNIGRLYTTGFVRLPHVTPYATVGLAYGWKHSQLGAGITAVSTRFHRALYNAGAGVEVPLVTQTSVRLGIDFEESFRKPQPKDWSYQLALDYHFDDTLCTDIGANLQDGRNGNRDSVAYHAGIRFIFD